MDKLALCLIAAVIIINGLSIHFVMKRNAIQDSLIFETLDLMSKVGNTMSSIEEDYKKLNERVERLEEREMR